MPRMLSKSSHFGLTCSEYRERVEVGTVLVAMLLRFDAGRGTGDASPAGCYSTNSTLRFGALARGLSRGALVRL